MIIPAPKTLTLLTKLGILFITPAPFAENIGTLATRLLFFFGLCVFQFLCVFFVLCFFDDF